MQINKLGFSLFSLSALVLGLGSAVGNSESLTNAATGKFIFLWTEGCDGTASVGIGEESPFSGTFATKCFHYKKTAADGSIESDYPNPDKSISITGSYDSYTLIFNQPKPTGFEGYYTQNDWRMVHAGTETPHPVYNYTDKLTLNYSGSAGTVNILFMNKVNDWVKYRVNIEQTLASLAEAERPTTEKPQHFHIQFGQKAWWMGHLKTDAPANMTFTIGKGPVDADQLEARWDPMSDPGFHDRHHDETTRPEAETQITRPQVMNYEFKHDPVTSAKTSKFSIHLSARTFNPVPGAPSTGSKGCYDWSGSGSNIICSTGHSSRTFTVARDSQFAIFPKTGVTVAYEDAGCEPRGGGREPEVSGQCSYNEGNFNRKDRIKAPFQFAPDSKLSFYIAGVTEDTVPRLVIYLHRIESLTLQNLELNLASEFYNLSDDQKLELLVAARQDVSPSDQSEPEFHHTKICFAADTVNIAHPLVCTDPQSDDGEVVYHIKNEVIPGYETLPDLELVISQDRRQVWLRKRAADATSNELLDGTQNGTQRVITITNWADDSFTAPISQAIGFMKKMLVDGLLGNTPVPVLGFIEPSNDARGRRPLRTGLIDWQFANHGALRVAFDTKLGWVNHESLRGTSQDYKLTVGGRYKQASGNLVTFYNRASVGGLHLHLLGALLQASYLMPWDGLSASVRLGGAFTPSKNGAYKAITTGLNLDYQHRFDRVVGVTVAPNLNFDLVTLFVKADDKTETELHLHGQAGLVTAVDTSDLLGSHRFKFDVPLQFGIIGKTSPKSKAATTTQTTESTGSNTSGKNNNTAGTDTGEAKSYDLYVKTGLNVHFTAWKNLAALVGYGFHYSNAYMKHSLKLRLRFQM